MDGAHHHDLPAGLAVADQARLALGLRVPGDDLLDKARLGQADILDRLARHRLRQEPDKITGVTGRQCDADLAVVLHAADARPVPGPRVEHDKRALAPIDRYARWRHNADQCIVDRPRQGASVEHEFGFEGQNVRCLTRTVLDVIVTALAQDIEQQDPPLPPIDPILERAIHTAHKVECLNGRGRAWHRPFGLLRHEISWTVKLFYSPDRKGQPYVQR
jgi:hypothetical protein